MVHLHVINLNQNRTAVTRRGVNCTIPYTCITVCGVVVRGKGKKSHSKRCYYRARFERNAISKPLRSHRNDTLNCLTKKGFQFVIRYIFSDEN